ncbi:MAG: 3,4-dihydroxy-2-butanone-4-phosphate synthase [Deltaproteobacteria bacterium]|nr:3,4-dihydroxy-2-butanone-4-phosphate synthase [Deltaproteobacteria bacterium]
MRSDPVLRVEAALADLRQGRMVILTDDEDRENEGDLVMAAELVTPEAINFMATHGRGLICLTLTGERIQQLGLPMMSSNNQSAFGTAFTVSVEAREGVSTGISAADRAHTILVALDEASGPQDLVSPGHMFPLKARDGGVLERVGQTEGSVDLARLAGLKPAGVICEVMNDDGSMARVPDLIAFGERHRVRMLSVADIIKYRMARERVVRRVSEGHLEVPRLGRWRTRLYESVGTVGLHMALWYGDPGPEPTLARVRLAPPPWAFLDPASPEWAPGVLASMQRVVEQGAGVIVFMHLGGVSREHLAGDFAQAFGGVGSEAQQAQAEALRDVGTGAQILRDLGLNQIRLLQRSHRNLVGLDAYGLQIVERITLEV